MFRDLENQSLFQPSPLAIKLTLWEDVNAERNTQQAIQGIFAVLEVLPL